MDAGNNGDCLKSLRNLDIVLASTAYWRSKILTQLGITHRRIDPEYQEPRDHSGSLDSFVKETALNKARSVSQKFPHSVIISADQLIVIDGETLYKPGNKSNAISQLKKLSGRRHQLICAVAVVFQSTEEVRAAKADLKMRDLSDNEIRNYVELDDPVHCAGSYKIESLGASLFEFIKVDDPTVIIGLPSALLIDILRRNGYSNLL